MKQDMCVYVHTDFTLMANCSYSPTKKALPKWVIEAKRKVAKINGDRILLMCDLWFVHTI